MKDDGLHHISILTDLDSEALNTLHRKAIKKTYSKNTILFSKGDQTDALYTIQKGKVKAVVMDEEGKEMVLNIHGPGDSFGEIALIDGLPRSATIITLEPVEVLIINRKDFLEVLNDNPRLAITLMKMILHRLRLATEKIEDLVFKDVYGRIASLLLQMAEKQDGKLVIEERLTHQEIANMVGASREMVSRIMKPLTVGGYLTIGKKHMVIEKKLPYAF
jgi:CRP/FNR family cyclic AMP-dependent transcriptional regulator